MNNRQSAYDMLIEAMVVGTDAMIERQEAQGQRDLMNSTVLPIDGSQQAAQMGITLLEPVDDLFVNVILPDGWHKQATDHSMWSDLLDDKGRSRAAIFYKAAFYDRSAHMSICRCINVTRRYGDDDMVSAAVVCGDEILFETAPIKRAATREYFDAVDADMRSACAWADTNYPNWRDVGAYWD